NALFGGVDDVDPEMVRRRDIRTRSLDKVHSSMSSFRNKLGQADRERLDQHAAWVEDLELRLEREAELVCSPPSQTNYPNGFSVRHDHHISAPNSIDMLVMALSCGMAPAATLYFNDASPRCEFRANAITSQYDNWHDMVHDGHDSGTARPGLIAGFRWFASQVAYLLERLDSIPDATAPCSTTP